MLYTTTTRQGEILYQHTTTSIIMDTQVKQPLLKSKNNNNIPNEIITLSGIIKHVRKHSSKLILSPVDIYYEVGQWCMSLGGGHHLIACIGNAQMCIDIKT